jgi:hypothetical protein
VVATRGRGAADLAGSCAAGGLLWSLSVVALGVVLPVANLACATTATMPAGL